MHRSLVLGLCVFGLCAAGAAMPSAGRVYFIPSPRGQAGCSQVTYLDEICAPNTCCLTTEYSSTCLGMINSVRTNLGSFTAYFDEFCSNHFYDENAPYCFVCGDGTSFYVGNDVPTLSPTPSPTRSPTAAPTALPVVPPTPDPPYTKTILVCVGIGAAFVISVAACLCWLRHWRRLPEEQPLIPATAVV